MESPVQELAGSAVSAVAAAASVAVSARALDQHGNKRRESKAQRIFDVVRDCQLAGVRDMTGNEIAREYERRFGARIDPGRVAARLDELVTADRLARREEARPCLITGYEARPVYVPPHQARLVA